jgi:hypothetical protein
MTNKKTTERIQLLDVVTLTEDLPEHNLWRGEIGTVVECYPDDGYEVEFVAQDGYTYALVTLQGDQLIPLRQKRDHLDVMAAPVAF